MPIRTRFDRALGIVIHQMVGDLHPEEVLASQRKLYASSDHDPTMPVLWDARSAHAWVVDFGGMSAMVERSRELWGSMRGGRTAIVVSSDADYGMGRMYQSLAENMPRKLEVFRDFDLAVAWLKTPADDD